MATQQHQRVSTEADPAHHRLIVTCSCRQRYAVPEARTTTQTELLAQAQYAHATGSPTRMCRAGCHFGDLADFDHYLDIHHVEPDNAADAFADYLRLDHGWQGQHCRVDLRPT